MVSPGIVTATLRPRFCDEACAMNYDFYRMLTIIVAMIVSPWACGQSAPAPALPAMPPQFEQGLDAARQQDWVQAAGDFKAAAAVQPLRTLIWYDWALAESHLPGHELRAAALLKAYLLQKPDSTQRVKIEALGKKLRSRIRANIHSILASLARASGDMAHNCFWSGNLQGIGYAYMRAGYYADARAMFRRAARGRCGARPLVPSRLAEEAAIGGDLSEAKSYQKQMIEEFQHQAPLTDAASRDARIGIIDGNETLLALFLENEPGSKWSLPSDEVEPFSEIVDELRELINAPKVMSLNANYLFYTTAAVQHAACLAIQQDWPKNVVRNALLRIRNLQLLSINEEDDRTTELIRSAASLYMLGGQQDAVDATLDGIDDFSVRQKYAALRVPNPDDMTRWQARNLIIDAFWPDMQNELLEFRPLMGTLICFGHDYEIEALTRLARDGISLDLRADNCGDDTQLAQCVNIVANEKAQSFDKVDDMTRVTNLMSAALSLVQF